MPHQVDHLNQRSNAFSLVLNDNELHLFKNSDNVLRQIMCSEMDVIFCAVIHHTMDMIDDLHQYKTPHYHVVIEFSCRYRIGSVINWISDLFHCNANQVSCEKCVCLSSQVRYLIHLDDFDKYHYDEFDIKSNNKDLVHRYIKEVRAIADVHDLYAIMEEYPKLAELIAVLGLEQYKKWRAVITDLRRERGLY